VLVVEDEASVREVVTRVLTRHGYRVHSAEDGAEAEAFLAQHDGNIDLLLTDVVMPGCSGPELYSRLSSREPSLAVLYMSGYADAARTDHTGLPPGELPLLKPFTPGQLLRRLQAVLTSHQAPSSLWPQSVLYSDVAGTVG
jgi:DNA-binding response OmpR family regulator